MSDLEPIQSRLRSFANSKPNAVRRALVEEGLNSKFEGTQALALKVLGAWGDRKSVNRLKEFLETAFDRKHGWGIRGVAIDALQNCLTDRDVEWVLGLFNSRSDGLEHHELRHLVDQARSLK